MPIDPIILQRRHAELGRIRLGNKGDRGQPQKLETFRFTSPSESYIGDLAALYGGQPKPWDNNGKAEFEVFTTAKTLPVVAVKGGLSQWLETWTGGGCIHRCDGIHNVLTDEDCDPRDPAHKNAKPTTRLSLMLPELEAIGVWRMETHGWNAAAEIPAVAELAQYVGDLVPAELHLMERRAVKDGKTSRFVVPVLDLKIGTQRLREIVESVSTGTELAAPTARPALEAAAPARDDFTPYMEQLADDVKSLDALAQLWDKARAAGLVGTGAADTPRAREFVAAWKAKAHALKPADQPQPDADGIVEAEIVEPPTPAQPGSEPDPDTVWQQILKAGGEKGMALDAITADFREVMGMIPDEASGSELASYLHTLTTGEEPAA